VNNKLLLLSVSLLKIYKEKHLAELDQPPFFKLGFSVHKNPP